MKNVYQPMLYVAGFMAMASSVFGQVQIVTSDANITNGLPATTNGEVDGASFISPSTPATLTIPNINPDNTPTTINSSGNAVGVANTTPNIATLNFLGSSTVKGSVGTSVSPIANIIGGVNSSLITFEGPVNSTLVNLQGNGTMRFNKPTSAALHFNTFDGTLIVDKTFDGALTNTATGNGTLILNANSILTGAVGDSTNALKAVTLNGNAEIVGATAAQTFNLNQYTLTNQGTFLISPTIGKINTTIISETEYGKIIVNGPSTVSGDLSINVKVDGLLVSNDPLTLLDATSGSGAVALPNVTSLSPLYSFTANYTSLGKIVLFPTILPVVPVVPGGGGGGSGGGSAAIIPAIIAVAVANPGSDIANVLLAVSALPNAGAVASAVAQFNPVTDGSIPIMSFAAAKQFQQLWSLHMSNGRCVIATECDDACTSGQRLSKAKLAECEKKMNAGCDSSVNCHSISNRWEAWIDGFGEWATQSKRHGHFNYDADLYGTMAGFQGPITTELSAGFGGGYAHTSIDRPRNNHTSINTYDGTFYLSFNPVNWYVDAAFSFDYNQYSDKRHISFPGIDRTAKASYGGQEYTGLVSGGYRYYKWCSIFTPLASLQYSHLDVNSYHETGAGDLDLHVSKQKYNFLESSLGMKYARPIQTTSGVIVPEIHALWLHDFYRDPMELSSTYSGDAAQAGAFATKGPGNDINFGDVGAGLTYMFCFDLSVEAVYNYQFGQTWSAQEALVKISQRF